jgi:hypothetical protein
LPSKRPRGVGAGHWECGMHSPLEVTPRSRTCPQEIASLVKPAERRLGASIRLTASPSLGCRRGEPLLLSDKAPIFIEFDHHERGCHAGRRRSNRCSHCRRLCHLCGGARMGRASNAGFATESAHDAAPNQAHVYLRLGRAIANALLSLRTALRLPKACGNGNRCATTSVPQHSGVFLGARGAAHSLLFNEVSLEAEAPLRHFLEVSVGGGVGVWLFDRYVSITHHRICATGLMPERRPILGATPTTNRLHALHAARTNNKQTTRRPNKNHKQTSGDVRRLLIRSASL